jgi:Brp/Blh family beta-carotene 15,15'-monooxygenase
MQSYPSLEKKYKTIQLVLLVNVALAGLILNFIDASLFSYELQYYILIFFVAIIGLPHGFFDYMISQKLYGHIHNWILKFTVGYVSLAFLYLLVWILYPIVALIIFLLLATVHFGMEEASIERFVDQSKILMIIIGSIPIMLPIMFHTDNVFFIFEQIIDKNLIVPDFNIILKSTYLLLIAVVLLLDYRKYLAYLFLIPCLIYLPPLISFVIYFCFHHSINHYTQSIFREKLLPQAFSLRTFLFGIGIISVVFTLIVLVVMVNLTEYSLDVAIAKYTFIILACLTLPHLLLNIYYETTKY